MTPVDLSTTDDALTRDCAEAVRQIRADHAAARRALGLDQQETTS